ncbi:hypothetical protein L208DRAFT_1277178, partial [Tricholoma matsutake]
EFLDSLRVKWEELATYSVTIEEKDYHSTIISFADVIECKGKTFLKLGISALAINEDTLASLALLMFILEGIIINTESHPESS